MSLIHDIDQLKQFYEFISQYQGQRLIMPTARNKYMQEPRGSIVFDRYIFDPKKHNMDTFINQIRRYQILLDNGLYNLKDGTPIKSEWIVIYITSNDLDPENAWDLMQIDMIKRNRDRRNQPELKFPNVISEYKTCLHKSIATKSLKLDVDTKDPVDIKNLQIALGGVQILIVVETKNGYHILFKPGSYKVLYDYIKVNKEKISLEKDNPNIAIPGLYQGGFKTRIIPNDDFLKLHN